jgi:hypothetical protein
MGLDNIIKRILNETKEEKLKKLFDDYISEYENLIRDEKEYEDEDYDIYTSLVFFKKNEDGEIDDDDWEGDNYVLKIIPIDKSGKKNNLEYSEFHLRGGLSTFGKSIFERLLKPWFESTYKIKVENVYPV